MVIFDQLGDEITVPENPQRIISLVPSQTELLYDLGLGNRVVGITKFCVHPESWFRNKERVGGTKSVDIEKVKSLNPDLIIGNKEENTKSDIDSLRNIAPVWMSDIYDLSDSLEMITTVGKICNVSKKAEEIVHEINRKFELLEPSSEQKSVLYLIWRNPYMGVGRETFIDSLLTEYLGFTNFLEGVERYPEVDLNKLKDAPDTIFLSSEPYPFKEKHFEELHKYFPNSEMYLVDGEYFSWYGSRLMKAPDYFDKLLSGIK